MGDRRQVVSAALFSTVLAGALMAPVPTHAQETDSKTIIACMVEKTTEENKQAMRDLMIAALQNNQPEMKKDIVSFGGIIVDLALKKCSMSFELVDKPAFEEIAQAYGERLGEALMEEAFARLK